MRALPRAPPRALETALGKVGSLGAGRTVAAMTAAKKKWVEDGMNLDAGPRESTTRARAVCGVWMGGEGREGWRCERGGAHAVAGEAGKPLMAKNRRGATRTLFPSPHNAP